MASKSLFSSSSDTKSQVRSADLVNAAGGSSYAYTPEHGLAQYALTGTFNGTYYASDKDQIDKVLTFAKQCGPEFVAKTAIYAREKGFMKDMPSFLLAHLATQDTALMKRVFPRIVDNPKMVRNFVQMLRSGQLGRKSLGTAPKKLVSNYLTSLSDDALLNATVGNSPSIKDVIKMVHPRVESKSRAALYGYILDKTDGSYQGEKFLIRENLTELAAQYEAFKEGLQSSRTESEKNALPIPNVRFELLTALPLTKEHWKTIARRSSWTQLRMNLNTFARHGVFEDKELTTELANKLANRELILKAKAFPYQLFAASLATKADVPAILTAALSDAADIAVENVPRIDGQIVAALDISGSMTSPATGSRGSATSSVTCLQIAALVGAALLRKNPSTIILPFSDNVVLPEAHNVRLNPRDSILTNAEKLAKLPSGGTNCSAPLQYLNNHKIKTDLVWFVSDNMSWVDNNYYGGTGTMVEFQKLKKHSVTAKMIRNDIQPYESTQAYERDDVLNFGGFSDQVFEVAANFARGSDAKSLVSTISAIEI